MISPDSPQPGKHSLAKLTAEEFARLKNLVETRKRDVDKAFAMLDDYFRKQEGSSTSIASPRTEGDEKLVLLERVMEAMSRLNAAYRDYVQVLEKEIGY